MKRFGILQRFMNQEIVFLYRNRENRECYWNSLTILGREKYGWIKVKVEIEKEAK